MCSSTCCCCCCAEAVDGTTPLSVRTNRGDDDARPATAAAPAPMFRWVLMWLVPAATMVELVVVTQEVVVVVVVGVETPREGVEDPCTEYITHHSKSLDNNRCRVNTSVALKKISLT